jgi:hypothetical protein
MEAVAGAMGLKGFDYEVVKEEGEAGRCCFSGGKGGDGAALRCPLPRSIGEWVKRMSGTAAPSTGNGGSAKRRRETIGGQHSRAN